VSVERIVSELHYIMAGSSAGVIVAQMVDCGLFAEILPELTAGSGVAQPSSHHLDVFDHNVEALHWMDQIVRDPARFFPESKDVFIEYLKTRGRVLWLKWAALCHDIGKTSTFKEDNGKITFYNHDHKGAGVFHDMARRLTFSNRDIERIGLLISQHMRPFFLCNNLRDGGVSTKACLRLARVIGDDLPGLFMVAMADSMAGKGENKPEKMEEELCDLFKIIYVIIEEKIRPVLNGPPLLTGNDLIKAGFKPGPLFKTILEEVEQLHVDGELGNRAEALLWLRSYKC
jgi:poly(A) polymerase